LQDIEKSEFSEGVKAALRAHVDKEAVLLITQLRVKSSDKLITIGNTHLSWARFQASDITCVQVSVPAKLPIRLASYGESVGLDACLLRWRLSMERPERVCSSGEDVFATIRKRKLNLYGQTSSQNTDKSYHARHS